MRVQPVNSLILAACLLLCLTSAQHAEPLPALPAAIQERALGVVSLVYQEDFGDALQEAKRITREFPDHPAGFFFCAVALDAWMAYHQSSKKEDEFYGFCDLAIEKGEILLDKDPTNAWVRFFVGGAEGLKGSYETRYERWLTAFRNGWKGVSVLKALREKYPELHDANYGIGTYSYWRTAMTRVMRWLPGVKDERESGIQCLYDSKDSGLFTRNASAANLLDILYNEGRYDEMRTISQEMLERYPGNMVFCWGKAEAEYGLGHLDTAEADLRHILSRLEAEPESNHYSCVMCHLWLARVHYAAGRRDLVTAEYNAMRGYKLSEEISNRVKKCFPEVEAMAAGNLPKPVRLSPKPSSIDTRTATNR